jgi:putative DNA primase/helicase
VRPAFSNAPVHAAAAPTPGTGKSFLMDVASAVAVGQPCHVIAAGRDEAETEKRLVACVLAGYPLVSIDNVNGELGGDFLCQLAERPLVSPRILGRSEQPLIPNRMTVFATGNNIRLKGDLVRRAVICQLDARAERPELRQFERNPVEKVLANRAHYVGAVLTVVRSYFAAGKPGNPPPFGSYTGWSESVRGALLWLGRADPVDTLAVARSEDPELQTLNAVLGAWAEAIGTGRRSACTAAHVFSHQNDLLRDAIELTGASSKKSPSRALGNWLASIKGRILGGRSFARLSEDTKGHAARWFIEEVP